jgi:hypothetical protein
MAKRKKVEEKPQTIICPTNPKEIKIFVRSWKLLTPVPYESKTNLKQINYLKTLLC